MKVLGKSCLRINLDGTRSTNGQAIYRKDPENNKETFEPAKKTGKVKLTINIATNDNLFDTKEVETELVP